jgi:hypothetical protein
MVPFRVDLGGLKPLRIKARCLWKTWKKRLLMLTSETQEPFFAKAARADAVD